MLVRDLIRQLKNCKMDSEVQVLKIVPTGPYEQTSYDFEKLKDIEAFTGYVQLSA